uniref:Uncharacterized protein n=1 Tax=Arundo donax TaxID=35708 RepID=A0A0A9FZB8_ARUDO
MNQLEAVLAASSSSQGTNRKVEGRLHPLICSHSQVNVSDARKDGHPTKLPLLQFYGTLTLHLLT